MLERIERAVDKSKPLDTCGGAILHLDVDGRSKIGKLLSSYEHPDFAIRKRDGLILHIKYQFEIVPPANPQDMYLRETANEVALEVIERRMGIQGHVRSYVD